jgi:hypothetical protein
MEGHHGHQQEQSIIERQASFISERMIENPDTLALKIGSVSHRKWYRESSFFWKAQ